MNSICLNGRMLPAGQPTLPADNKGYRYGDGLFETMKLLNGNILLDHFHFQRFFDGLALLKIQPPPLITKEKITKDILDLARRNGCLSLARVRLSASRGAGGIYDEKNEFQYLIECWPLEDTVNRLNENGLVIGVYPDARKSCDAFSLLKSANYLPYVMAAQYAKEQRLNDCLVLNSRDRIADATIANLFLIRQGHISTPSLDEGCVGGVMRKYLLEELPALGYPVRQVGITVDDLATADELFLSNAITGIRWVKKLGDRVYGNALTQKIYEALVKTFFP